MRPDEGYELLTQQLASELARAFGVLTTRCDRLVRMQGRGTANVIDVVWEGVIDEALHRVVIECKHYKRRVDQGRLHAFRSVLDDIGDDVETTGVFVTTAGYQSGAKDLASTYGMVVLELRPPEERDLAGVVTQIALEIVVRTPLLEDLCLVVDPGAPERIEPTQLSGAAVLEVPGRSPQKVVDFILEDALSPLGRPPTPLHRVSRELPTGSRVREADHVLEGVRSISATVGDSDSRIRQVVGPGAEGIGYVLKDSISGATVWIEKDGKVTIVGDHVE